MCFGWIVNCTDEKPAAKKSSTLSEGSWRFWELRKTELGKNVSRHIYRCYNFHNIFISLYLASTNPPTLLVTVERFGIAIRHSVFITRNQWDAFPILSTRLFYYWQLILNNIMNVLYLFWIIFIDWLTVLWCCSSRAITAIWHNFNTSFKMVIDSFCIHIRGLLGTSQRRKRFSFFQLKNFRKFLWTNCHFLSSL